MPLLIILLYGVAVFSAVLALTSLLGRPQREVVASRLRRLGLDPKAEAPGADPRSLRLVLEETLGTLGGRLDGDRRNLDALTEELTWAGFRKRNAVALFLAGRIVLALGSAAAGALALPLVDLGGTRTAAILAPALAGWIGPRFWLGRRVAARQKQIRRTLPDALDLLVVCVEAGLGLNQAIARVAREIEPVSPEMAVEFRTLNLEIQAGTPRDEAFRNLGARTGVEDLNSLATMLIQADRFGTSIAQALRVHALSLRTRRRQGAEEAAAKTTVKLVFPLVLFIFPALFIVILGPALVAVLRS